MPTDLGQFLLRSRPMGGPRLVEHPSQADLVARLESVDRYHSLGTLLAMHREIAQHDGSTRRDRVLDQQAPAFEP